MSSRTPRRKARGRDVPPRSRSPGDRSNPLPRAARRASSGQCKEAVLSVEAVCDDEEVRGGCCEEQRVDAIEHSAVAAEEPSGVLHLEIALQRRLEEVAE